MVGIEGGIIHIATPSGEASGTINPDGTAHLTGPNGSYDLLSSQGTTLNLREVNGPCTFLTTIVLQQPLPPLGGAVVPQETATSAPTTEASVSAPTAVVATGPTSSTEEGGSSLWWVWGAVGALGLVAVGGGVMVLRCRCWAARTDALVAVTPARDCSKERQAVEEALRNVQTVLEWPALQGALGSPRVSDDALEELRQALKALADCEGMDPSEIPAEMSGYNRIQTLLRHFGFPPLGRPDWPVPLANLPPDVPPDVPPVPPVPPEEGEIG